MPEGSVPLLIALIVLVLLSGFFSAAETAFSCASRIKLRALAGGGNKRAAKTLDIAENKFDKLLRVSVLLRFSNSMLICVSGFRFDVVEFDD